MSSSVNYYFLAVLNELHRGKEKTGKPKVKGNWANNTDRSAPLLSSLPGQLPLDIGLSDFAVSAYVIASWACGVTRGPIRIVLFVLSWIGEGPAHGVALWHRPGGLGKEGRGAGGEWRRPQRVAEAEAGTGTCGGGGLHDGRSVCSFSWLPESPTARALRWGFQAGGGGSARGWRWRRRKNGAMAGGAAAWLLLGRRQKG